MNRTSIAGIAVVGVLVAAVVFWKTRGGDGDKPKETAVTEQQSTDEVAKPAGGDDDRSSRRGQGEVSVLVDDDPEGTLLLQGQVVIDKDTPVAGATVIINSVPPKSTISEQDGSFEFDKLVGRPYELIARAPEGVAGPVTARLSQSNEPVILHIKPAAKVVVTVLDADKREPVSGATVELRDLDTQTEVTDAEGIATIGGVVPGGYEIAAHAPGFSTTHAWLRVSGGNTIATATVQLRRGAPVVGKVVSPDGKPVEGAAVLYAGASDWAQQADPRLDAVKSDKQGMFRFEALPEGTFRFVARHEGFAPGRSELVTLDGSIERTGIIVEMEPGATINGLVVSTTNAPMGGSRVRVGVKVAGMGWSRPRQVYANDEGTFTIDGLPRKPLQLVAMHETASSSLVDVDMTSKQEQEVTLTLDVADTIEGIVLDTEGEPVEGAQVSAFPDFRKGAQIERGEWQLRGFPSELTGTDGKFVLAGLKPGAYTVRAAPPGAANTQGSAWLREGVDAESGDKNVKLILEADGGMEGIVQFADGEPPSLFSIGFGWRASTPFSTKDGAFKLEDLPPNTYTVTIRGAGFDTRSVTDVKVEGGKITDLGKITVKKGRSIKGRVVAQGEPVEGATVIAGGILFGSGSSATAAGGGGGPPGAQNAKSVTTDANGEFSLSGVGNAQRALVAEHDTKGRSKTIIINRSLESTEDLEIVLEPYGALEGTVTKGGQPAEEVRVGASSTSAGGAIFGVGTGPDGKFRFDKLAPDTYKVSAVLGVPFRGMSFHSKTVKVESGETARVDLTVNVGAITLEVTPTPSNADKVSFAFVNIIAGVIRAANGSELSAASAAAGDAFSTFGMAMMGRPASVSELVPGTYSVCVQAFPNELQMTDFGEYMDRMSDVLPVVCQTVQVTEAPEAQSVSVTVAVPAYVPPEGGDTDPS